VELLVALTIGLVISLAVAALYFSTNASKQAFDDVTVLRDSARAALQLMGEQIRTAGYGLLDSTGKNVFQGSARTGQETAGTPYGFPIFGCSKGFSADPPGTACLSSGSSPAFSVAYQAEPGSDLRDCEGNQGSDLGTSGYVRSGFTAPANSKLVMSSFRLSGQQLQCQGSGASWQVIVDNVVSFTVEYGVDTDKNLGQPSEAARSVNEWSAAGPSSPADWADVVAVRLCIVLQSAPGAGVSNTSYTDCSGANTQGAENRVYQRLTSTVQIRNIRPAVS
jgi:type IV pilus assembly protein PilW